MSNSRPVVELCDVTFTYLPRSDALPALEAVSLRVEADDFLGIIGPNGGGKTTLLKVILGQLRPQRGQVRVFGTEPQSVRQRIGYVPQHARVDPAVPANVLDLVLTGRLGRSPWGPWFGRKHVEAAMNALEQTETAHLADRPIGTFSGGQRRGVLVAWALAPETELLLLDEPTSGVDPAISRTLIDLLHRLNERIPIVVVSHDVSFVSRHLKHVACLNRRLTCHPVDQVSGEVIRQMYDGHVQVEHREHCPLHQPDCQWGCSLAEPKPPEN